MIKKNSRHGASGCVEEDMERVMERKWQGKAWSVSK